MKIGDGHSPEALKNLKIYISILSLMTVYYLAINIHKVQAIKNIYPPLFDAIKEYDGCINASKSNSKLKSVSIWYVSYLVIYIIIFASVIVYILTHLESNKMIFSDLGDGVITFIMMMVFLVVIVNQIVFFDKTCFSESKLDSKTCTTPKCDPSTPYFDLSNQICVKEPSPSPPPSPPPPPPPPPGSGNDNDNDDDEGKTKIKISGGAPGPPGPPGPPGSISSVNTTTIATDQGKSMSSMNPFKSIKDLLQSDIDKLQTDITKIKQSKNITNSDNSDNSNNSNNSDNIEGFQLFDSSSSYKFKKEYRLMNELYELIK